MPTLVPWVGAVWSRLQPRTRLVAHTNRNGVVNTAGTTVTATTLTARPAAIAEPGEALKTRAYGTHTTRRDIDAMTTDAEGMMYAASPVVGA